MSCVHTCPIYHVRMHAVSALVPAPMSTLSHVFSVTFGCLCEPQSYTHFNYARVRSCLLVIVSACIISQLSTPLPLSAPFVSLIIITSRQVQSFARCQYTSRTSTCSCVFEIAHRSYGLDQTDPISNHHLHVCPEQDVKLLVSYDFVCCCVCLLGVYCACVI